MRLRVFIETWRGGNSPVPLTINGAEKTLAVGVEHLLEDFEHAALVAADCVLRYARELEEVGAELLEGMVQDGATHLDNGPAAPAEGEQTDDGGGPANTSAPIATDPPITEPPPTTTEPPATDPPTTEAPTTEPPTTEPPTTAAPVTDAPTTEAPSTEAPTTEAPTTLAPTTDAPSTEAPTTEAPTTAAPTSAPEGTAATEAASGAADGNQA